MGGQPGTQAGRQACYDSATQHAHVLSFIFSAVCNLVYPSKLDSNYGIYIVYFFIAWRNKGPDVPYLDFPWLGEMKGLMK